MKALLMISLFVSFAAFSFDEDPAYCGQRSSCHNRGIPMLSRDSYYARGSGTTCDQARAAADEAFLRQFGNIDGCGIYSGPYNSGCYTLSSGRIISWQICDQNGGEYRGGRRSGRCAMIGGVLAC